MRSEAKTSTHSWKDLLSIHCTVGRRGCTAESTVYSHFHCLRRRRRTTYVVSVHCCFILFIANRLNAATTAATDTAVAKNAATAAAATAASTTHGNQPTSQATKQTTSQLAIQTDSTSLFHAIELQMSASLKRRSTNQLAFTTTTSTSASNHRYRSDRHRTDRHTETLAHTGRGPRQATLMSNAAADGTPADDDEDDDDDDCA